MLSTFLMAYSSLIVFFGFHILTFYDGYNLVVFNAKNTYVAVTARL